jgi:dynein heavy chain
MPPRSGSIAWARSIITRIKTPIDKFTTKPEILTDIPAGIKAAKLYVNVAKELTEVYEFNRFQEWKSKNTVEAINMLHDHILRSDRDANDRPINFKVNFNPKLKVIIREAKFLDRIGKDIPPTIINIALQEKDYMKYIDKLNQLLRNYN